MIHYYQNICPNPDITRLAGGEHPSSFYTPSPEFFSIPSLVHLYTIPCTAVIGAMRAPLPQLPLNPWHAPNLLFSDKSPFDPPSLHPAIMCIAFRQP